MCLIGLAYRAVPGIELAVAANRDEFFERPTAPAQFWQDEPSILAGRDLRARGTWLGVSRAGRFGAITNFRNPRERLVEAPSRGALVSAFLKGRERAQSYLASLAPAASAFNGFSLLLADGRELWFLSNKDRNHGTGGAASRVEPGFHGLSNHLLDEPWPKVQRVRDGLRSVLAGAFDAEDLLQLLADETTAADEDLPDTGLGLERERKASAIRVRDPVYGTRCSTVLIVRDSGDVEFHERTFEAEGGVAGTVSFSFSLERPAQDAYARAQSPPPRTPDRSR